MDKKVYAQLTRDARNNVKYNIVKVMKKQAQIYRKASDVLAENIRTHSGELNVNTFDMAKQLDQLSTSITEGLSNNLDGALRDTVKEAFHPTKEHLYDVGFKTSTVQELYQAVNDDVIYANVNRVYQDGYNFSQRLWIEGQKTQMNIKDILNMGIAEGRDPIEIARDIQVYTKDGKAILMKRYGRLKAGTERFVKRIPNNVDYRAMRIVKTEIYNSLRDAEVLSATADPGTTGLFDWIRAGGAADYGCLCPDYVAGSPYTKDEVPTNPHPNCSCYIQAQLRNHNDYVNDLASWANGGNVPYLDEWAQKYGYDNTIL